MQMWVRVCVCVCMCVCVRARKGLHVGVVGRGSTKDYVGWVRGLGPRPRAQRRMTATLDCTSSAPAVNWVWNRD